MAEEIEFYSSGLRLTGLFYKSPVVREEKGPVIVCVHGYSGRKETYMPGFSRELTAAGYHVMDFYHRGFGDSDGIKLRNDPEEQVADILSALIYVRQRPEVDTKRVGLLGLSHGGGTTVKASALDGDVACTVSLGGPGNGRRWMLSKRSYSDNLDFEEELKVDRVQRVVTGKSRRVTYEGVSPPGRREKDAFKTMYTPEKVYPEGYPLENFDLALKFAAEDYVHLISPRPIMFIHTEMDTMVPVGEGLSLYAKAQEPKKIVLIPDAAHADVYEPVNPPVFNVVIDNLKSWYGEHL